MGCHPICIEHMALKALQHDAETRFSLEDVFDAWRHAGKLAWVNGWRKLPHIDRKYNGCTTTRNSSPKTFTIASSMLRRRVSDDEANTSAQTGRLFILLEDGPAADSKASLIEADSYDETQLLSD